MKKQKTAADASAMDKLRSTIIANTTGPIQKEASASNIRRGYSTTFLLKNHAAE